MPAAVAFVITCTVVGYSVVTGGGTASLADDDTSVVTSGLTSGGTGGGAEGSNAAASAAPREEAATELGETRSRANSDTTLLQVRKVLAPADRSAPKGQEWYGIRARTCMHADADASGDVSWSEWVVSTSTGLSYSGRRTDRTDFPPQQYSTNGIGSGRCTVGWILVVVPRGSFQKVVSVTFRPTSPDKITWAV